MLYYIFLGLLVSLPFIIALVSTTDDDLGFAGGFFIGLIVDIIPAFFVFTVWAIQATDIADYTAQSKIISVYEERITSLTKRLAEFTYPSDSPVLFNHDSPVAAIVTSISEAEKGLLSARKIEARAYKRLIARRLGPWSGVNFILPFKKD
jgi:hypothetical protein